MSFDLKLNLATGDLEWNSIRDLSGVEAENLIQQRIHTRLKIERGSFIYDRTGTLGSRLSAMLASGVPRNAQSLRMLIQEALTPMDDINITNIDVFVFGDGSGIVTDPRVISASISYDIVYATTGSDLSVESGQSTTLVSIPT